jgi:hypothetical protein
LKLDDLDIDELIIEFTKTIDNKFDTNPPNNIEKIFYSKLLKDNKQVDDRFNRLCQNVNIYFDYLEPSFYNKPEFTYTDKTEPNIQPLKPQNIPLNISELTITSKFIVPLNFPKFNSIKTFTITYTQPFAETTFNPSVFPPKLKTLIIKNAEIDYTLLPVIINYIPDTVENLHLPSLFNVRLSNVPAISNNTKIKSLYVKDINTIVDKLPPNLYHLSLNQHFDDYDILESIIPPSLKSLSASFFVLKHPAILNKLTNLEFPLYINQIITENSIPNNIKTLNIINFTAPYFRPYEIRKPHQQPKPTSALLQPIPDDEQDDDQDYFSLPLLPQLTDEQQQAPLIFPTRADQALPMREELPARADQALPMREEPPARADQALPMREGPPARADQALPAREEPLMFPTRDALPARAAQALPMREGPPARADQA